MHNFGKVAVLMGGFRVSEQPDALAAVAKGSGELSNSKALGKLLYTEYIYPLEVATAILLVGMVAAIALTLRQRKDSKAISASNQVHVRARDRFQLVSMPVTQQPLPPVQPASAVEEKKT